MKKRRENWIPLANIARVLGGVGALSSVCCYISRVHERHVPNSATSAASGKENTHFSVAKGLPLSKSKSRLSPPRNQNFVRGQCDYDNELYDA